MDLEKISREFTYDFLLQAKKLLDKEKVIKPKIKDIKTKTSGELPFIRHLFHERKPSEVIKTYAKENIKPKIEEIKKESAIDKIERLMEDSTVNSIECRGPEKNVIIRRDEKMIETSVALNDKEITEIFKIIENESREGLGKIFKANFRNFVIHGIKSDFIGSSFILERKNPNIQ